MTQVFEIKGKVQRTALCNYRQSRRFTQLIETKVKSALTALTALRSALRPHFDKKNSHLGLARVHTRGRPPYREGLAGQGPSRPVRSGATQ